MSIQAWLKLVFGPKARCPRCNSKKHFDPIIHNIRMSEAAEEIARRRIDLEMMYEMDFDEEAISFQRGQLVKMWRCARRHQPFADPQYQDLDALIAEHTPS